VRLVVDASVLVAELLRTRGRALVAHPALQLYLPERTWDEATHELAHRVETLVQGKRLSRPAAGDLIAAATVLVDAAVMIVPEVVYAPAKQRALARVPRDPDDWPAVALAMVLDAGIWTGDADFLGCGLPTWTTDTLLAEVTRDSQSR